MANSRLCSVLDCDKPAHARGWCKLHYFRWRRHGDATAGRCVNGVQWQYMLDHMHDECPKWPYNLTKGRGYIYDPRFEKQRLVHTIVCELVNGPRPIGYQAAHICGLAHKGCFGASCLIWKTPSDNQMDRVAHGTSNRGTRHAHSKLNDEIVCTIRSNPFQLSQGKLARTYGVTRETIRDIQKRRIWAWLP